MYILNSARFDDVDHEVGYAYHGFSYLILDEAYSFLIKTYDDEPGHATVVRPSTVLASSRLRSLIDFLKSELGLSRVSIYQAELGRYAEIDPHTFTFIKT